MATMVNGTNMVLSIDDTSNTADGTTPVLTAIAAATSCTLNLTIDAPEITDKTSGDRKEYCASPIIASYPRRVFVKFLGTTGGNNYSGYGYITSLSATGGTEDAASYSVTIQGTAGLTYAAS
jgi:predicted secreted protein